MIGIARHYNDMDIDRYDDAEVVCDRDTDDDGSEIIRIEALAGEPDDWPLGRPGVSIELSMDDAITLMARLSEVTMPNHGRDRAMTAPERIDPAWQRQADATPYRIAAHWTGALSERPTAFVVYDCRDDDREPLASFARRQDASAYADNLNRERTS